MSVETFLADSMTRRQVFIERFGGGESDAALKFLDQLRVYVRRRLMQDVDDVQSQRLSVLLADIEDTSRQIYMDIGDNAVVRLESFAQDQGEFIREMLNRATNDQTQFLIPTNQQLTQAVTGGDMLVPLGKTQITVGDAIAQFAEKKTAELMNTINNGILTGQTRQQITKAVEDLITTRHRRHSETLVRTITNHAANQVTIAVYKENQALLDGYEWVSVLDHRTSLICAGRDGKVYKVGKGPVPPAHFRCRSATVPKIVDTYKRERVGPKESEANQTYGQWLKKQPPEFQSEVLGPVRAKLFREGGLEIDQFRDEVGRTYTLDQLRALNPVAFQDAGFMQPPIDQAI